MLDKMCIFCDANALVELAKYIIQFQNVVYRMELLLIANMSGWNLWLSNLEYHFYWWGYSIPLMHSCMHNELKNKFVSMKLWLFNNFCKHYCLEFVFFNFYNLIVFWCNYFLCSTNVVPKVSIYCIIFIWTSAIFLSLSTIDIVLIDGFISCLFE